MDDSLDQIVTLLAQFVIHFAVAPLATLWNLRLIRNRLSSTMRHQSLGPILGRQTAAAS